MISSREPTISCQWSSTPATQRTKPKSSQRRVLAQRCQHFQHIYHINRLPSFLALTSDLTSRLILHKPSRLCVFLSHNPKVLFVDLHRCTRLTNFGHRIQNINFIHNTLLDIVFPNMPNVVFATHRLIIINYNSLIRNFISPFPKLRHNPLFCNPGTWAHRLFLWSASLLSPRSWL